MCSELDLNVSETNLTQPLSSCYMNVWKNRPVWAVGIVWYSILHILVHNDKRVANSQWCHLEKWESSCLQLPCSLINSRGGGLMVTAKQGRFIEQSPSALSSDPFSLCLYYPRLPFKSLVLCYIFSSLSLHLPLLNASCVSACACMCVYDHVCCSPAATRTERVKAGPTRVTLPPRHADSTRTPSFHITLQTHWAWRGQPMNSARRNTKKKKREWKGVKGEKRAMNTILNFRIHLTWNGSI